MQYNHIDELALLKAFIDFQALSYTELQERQIVPVLNKQDRRVMFKNTIDKFIRWGVIEAVADSHPKVWTVKMDNAVAEYNKMKKEIEQRQLVDKYSFEGMQEDIKLHSRKLIGIKVYRILAVSGFILAVFNFVTGLSLAGMYATLKQLLHNALHR